MKTIIAGSRDFTNAAVVESAIVESGFHITEVVCGECHGVDKIGAAWAKRNGIHVEPFPAEWKKYGKPAGPIRNHRMGDYADALIAVWDGHSPGTGGMIRYARQKGLKVFVKSV